MVTKNDQQSNFYRQVRNLDINIEDTKTEKAAGLHWQVAQATSLTNVNIRASRDPKTTQMGMFTENGSGGFMSFVNIIGGKYGICKHQARPGPITLTLPANVFATKTVVTSSILSVNSSSRSRLLLVSVYSGIGDGPGQTSNLAAPLLESCCLTQKTTTVNLLDQPLSWTPISSIFNMVFRPNS